MVNIESTPVPAELWKCGTVHNTVLPDDSHDTLVFRVVVKASSQKRTGDGASHLAPFWAIHCPNITATISPLVFFLATVSDGHNGGHGGVITCPITV